MADRKKTNGGSQQRPVRPLGPALRLALITISAALYSAAIGITAPITTPWGVGQFRPGVVFPSVFAIIYGPLIGGAGAAIGTFIGDVVFLTPLGLTTPLLSVIAGVPGNFVGFYLLGWFMRRYRSWTGFIVGSFLALLVGNLVAGTGVVIYLAAFSGWSSFPLDTLIGATLGFTFFWLVTMIPFEVALVPPLIHTIQPLVGGRLDLGLSGWRRGTGSEALRSSLAIGGIMGVMYLLVQFTALGDLLFKSITAPEFIPWLKLLFLVAAATVLLFGVIAGFFLRPTQKN